MVEALSALNWVDYLIIIGLVRGAVMGYREGLWRELVRILILIVAYCVAIQFSAPMAELINLNTVVGYRFAQTLSIAVIGISVYVLLWIMMGMILRFLDAGESIFLKGLGSLVGLAKWAFILSLVLQVLVRSNVSTLREDIEDRSLSGSSIHRIAPLTLDFLSAYII